jgi:EcoRII C terminal/Restriction endonuclease EcoRII, N-terminal
MGPLDSLRDWLVHVGSREWRLYAKRLSANDTGLTGGHQVGFYVPHRFAMAVAPELDEDVLNPRRELDFDLVSHGERSSPSLIYYNNRYLTQGTRNEFRVTGFGGAGSALQDPDSTGAVLLTAWREGSARVEAWLAESAEQEDVIEEVVGPVEPATHVMRLAPGEDRQRLSARDAACEPPIGELPASWAVEFPPGRALADEAVRRRPGRGHGPDTRLMERYRCEFGLFKVVESAHVVPLIAGGFPSVESFLGVAQTVANRRKSRAGRSLELHLAKVFDEEGVTYQTGVMTEDHRRPDFVFPSITAYRSGEPTRMLGVKTSVKERWRQVLDEAAKIPEKHLFTLSEGVSPDQFRQMDGAGLRLVVPQMNVVKFPAPIRPRLMTLADFLAFVR